MDMQAKILPYGRVVAPGLYKARYLVLATVAVSLGLLAWRWRGPSRWELARDFYLERRCMNYSPRPEQVVFSYQAGKSRQLDGVTYTGYPACWIKLGTANNLARILPAPPGHPLLQKLPTIPLSTLFLHRMKSRAGADYLVEVILIGTPRGHESLDFLAAETYHPGTLFKGMSRTYGCSGALLRQSKHQSVREAKTITIYAGQLDPADSSHFTVRYTMDGGPGTVEGFLRDDGSLEISVRDGPMLLDPHAPSE